MRWTMGIVAFMVGMSVPAFADDAPRTRAADQDQQFIQKATASGMAEVTLSKRALNSASRKEVKEFAHHMVEDHTKANEELMGILKNKDLGRSAATTMSAEHRAVDARLAALKDEEFDRAYMRQMVKDHEDAVKLFESQSRMGQDEDLKKFATRTLPTLKKHLEMARKTAGDRDSDTRNERDKKTTDKK